MRILIIDDDKNIVEVLTKLLLQQNYVVDVAEDGEVGWEFVESLQYDLILLDVMLPKLDGISFCRRLRERKNQALVMLLTARDTTTDKLIGLDSGADDYVVKPFNIPEFSARIRALIRRGSTHALPIVTCGDLHLDTNMHEVAYQGKPLKCSRKEYLLLELFLRNQKRVYSCQEIIDHLWAFDAEPPNNSTVRSHIKNIRRELKSVGADGFLETVYGQGYRINPLFISATNDQKVVQRAQNLSKQVGKQEILDLSVTEIWQQTKGLSLERLSVIQQFLETIKLGIFDETLYQQTIHNAHKLAGSLGMFGFDSGSTLARRIEVLLQVESQFLLKSQPADSHNFVKQLELLVIKLSQELTDPIKVSNNVIVAATDTPQLAATPNTISAKIFLVDHDLQVQRTIKTLLETLGLQIVCLQEQEHFWGILRSSNPDFLILDISMPINNGLALCRSVRQNPDWNWLPILFLTANDDFSTRQQVFTMGGDDYVTKPIVVEELSTRILNRIKRIESIRNKIEIPDAKGEFKS